MEEDDDTRMAAPMVAVLVVLGSIGALLAMVAFLLGMSWVVVLLALYGPAVLVFALFLLRYCINRLCPANSGRTL
ncbi:MAG: hypothetical protein ACK5M4_06455 [Pseudorhodobacter sp.]